MTQLLRRTLLNALAVTVGRHSGRSMSSGGGGIGGIGSEIISSLSIIPEEITLPCSDGTILAAQRYVCVDNTSNDKENDNNQPRETILCIHGWMDNCRSFHYLAPTLASTLNNNNYQQVITLDLPGHGMSSHKSTDAPPMVQSEFVYYVSEAIQAIDRISSSIENEGTTIDDERETTTTTTTLIGHSLGAGISSLYSAAFPEQISKLVLLDGAGFLARESKDTALHVRKHVQSRQDYQRKQQQQQDQPNASSSSSRIYPSLEHAIKTRRLSTTRMPSGVKKQSISYGAAKELVERGTIPTNSNGGGIQFRHDPRFAFPSIQYMTWEQCEGIFKAVQADVCLLIAKDGYPFKASHIERSVELLQPTILKTLPGSHYFHADPETADAVIDSILEFLLDGMSNDDENN